MPRPLLVFLHLGLVFLLSSTALAQSEEVDAWFSRGERFASKGLWRRAGNFFEKVLKEEENDEEAAFLLAQCWLGSGNYDELDPFLKIWSERKKSRKWILLRHDFLRELARDDEALTVLKTQLGDGKDFELESLIARIHEEHGRDDEAGKIFEALVDRSKEEVIRDAPSLVGLARAQMFWAHGGDDAERALNDAKKVDADFLPAYIEMARLFGSRKELPVEMGKEIRLALEKRPRWPSYQALLIRSFDLRLGMAEGQVQQTVAEILGINPRHPVALYYRGMKQLSDALWEASRKTFTEALIYAPEHKQLLSGLAALHYVIHEHEDFKRVESRVLSLDPKYGGLYQVVAEGLNERRRWDESLAMMQKAVSVDPDDFRLWDDLARYALYIGEEEEGAKALEKADALVKYGRPWRNNMKTVMELLAKKFVTVKSEHFIMKLHRDDAAVLEKIIPPFLERSYDEFVELYGLEPKLPVIFDVFQRNADFSVRTMGTTGLGALGVCFGPTVYMYLERDSQHPTNWEGTAHHELAHVFTLQRSRGRLPRWFTEGLSSWEEVRRNPSWGRNMEVLLHDELMNDSLLKVLDFDSAFYGPQIIYAYFQAGVACQFIEETWGMEAIRKMLTLYGDDRLSDEVLREALEVSPKEFDERFEEWVRRMLEPMKRIPTYSRASMARFQKLIDQGEDVEANQIKLAWGHYRSGNLIDTAAAMKPLVDADCQAADFRLLMAARALSLKQNDEAREIYEALVAEGFENVDMSVNMARMLEKEGKGERAVDFWKLAKKQNPWNVDPDRSPYIVLADRYLKAGDLESWAKETAEFCALVDNAVDKRLALVDYHKERGNYELVLRYLDEILSVTPFSAAQHVERGKVLVDLKRPEEALLAFEIALELRPERQEEFDLRLSLARLLINLDRSDDAVYHLVRALELKPGHPEAAKLLELADSPER